MIGKWKRKIKNFELKITVFKNLNKFLLNIQIKSDG